MKKLLFWLLVTSPVLTEGQDIGVHFVHQLSWQGILEKARAENKYVFVDCYATWCSPCRTMDKKVYPVDSIGTFMNDQFICVKIQMDTTGHDDMETRGWYETARQIAQQYQIKAYPTYLFFAPDGRVVHEDLGFKGSNAFLSMATAAMDSSKQYYTLLAKYRHSDKNYTLMPMLGDEAKELGQDSIYNQVARDYMHNYVQVLPADIRWSKENILIVNKYSELINLQDNLFQSYYQYRIIIDSVMRDPQYADYLINDIIYWDLIKSTTVHLLTTKSEPQWNRLEKDIEKRYDKKYVRNNVLKGRIEYYRTMKKWNYYVKYFIRQQERYGIESWTKSNLHRYTLNNDAYEIFLHSNNRKELEKALLWVDRALLMDESSYADAIDTKANILYKLGKKEEAIALETKSHTLSPGNREITANYEKMKKGLPTWSDN
jgi:thiol-disulfide isomerase/thioredoxin